MNRVMDEIAQAARAGSPRIHEEAARVNHPEMAMRNLLEEAHAEGEMGDFGPGQFPKNGDAAQAVVREREKQYGRPRESFQRLANLANSVFADKLTMPLTAREAALFMLLVKVGREAHQHSADNTLDIQGYAKVIDAIHEDRSFA